MVTREQVSAPRIYGLLFRDAEWIEIARRAETAGYGFEHWDHVPRAEEILGASPEAWLVGHERVGGPSSVVRRLREASSQVPIVTVVDDTSTLAETLIAGATDAVLRPVCHEELLARLFGRIPPTRVLDAPRLHGLLRRAELAVLEYIVVNAPRVVSVQEILTNVLRSSGDGGSVRNHVWEIRRKLSAAGIPAPLRTVRGVGYCAVQSQRDGEAVLGEDLTKI